MNTLAEVSSADIIVASSALTWTGLEPGYKLSNENAATLLAYCGGLASAAVWVIVDVGKWKRSELRRRYTPGSDEYNKQVGLLYSELSEYWPNIDSATSWRSYLNVADAVPYEDRVEGAGPAVYIPGMTLPPDAWVSFIHSVKEGTHRDFLAQMYGKQVEATRIASTTSTNGYAPHAEDDDIPYSASGPGVVAEAEEWVEEYENNSDSNLPVLSWSTLAQVRALVTAVLSERWTEAVDIAEGLEPVIA